MSDAELEAMAGVVAALNDLNVDVRERVLRWAAERYDVALGSGDQGRSSRDGRGHGDRDQDDAQDLPRVETDGAGGSSGRFNHFAELHDAAAPSTDAERALVAGYWVQFILGKDGFGSLEANGHLKDLGHASAAINKAMSQNMRKKPALILQIARGGNSQQARKKYKLSEAGKKWVESRLP